jgi:hypothetical protein
MLILAPAVFASAAFAAVGAPATIQGRSNSLPLALFKEPMEAVYLIKARPKFISHQRNPIMH